MTQPQFWRRPKLNLILGSNGLSKFLIWSSAPFRDPTPMEHAFHLSTAMTCLECLLPYSFQRLSVLQGSFPPEAFPDAPGIKWFSFAHRSSWILCAKTCAWQIITFTTLNPYNSPMKCRPLLSLIYRKGNWGTINLIKSDNAPDSGLNTLHGLPILSVPQPHYIGALTVIFTWLTRKPRLWELNLPKFPQRWGTGSQIKPSVVSLESH